MSETAVETLGVYLKRLRAERRLTLRQVEKITMGSVSNGHLSQIEGDQIKAPSVVILHRLSAAYGVDFADLCERACVGNRPPEPRLCPTCGQPI